MRERTVWKRIASVALCMTMALNNVPSSVLAEDTWLSDDDGTVIADELYEDESLTVNGQDDLSASELFSDEELDPISDSELFSDDSDDGIISENETNVPSQDDPEEDVEAVTEEVMDPAVGEGEDETQSENQDASDTARVIDTNEPYLTIADGAFILQALNPVYTSDHVSYVLDGENVISAGEDKISIDMSQAVVSALNEVSFDVMLSAGPVYDQYTDETVTLQLPENMETAVTAKVVGSAVETADQIEDAAAGTVSVALPKEASYEEGEAMAILHVVMTPILSSFTAYAANEALLQLDGQDVLSVGFDTYDVVSGISQTESAYRLPEKEGIRFNVTVGADTPYQDLTGYTISDTFDPETLNVIKIEDEEGNALTWESAEEGTLQPILPDGAVTPWSYSVYFQYAGDLPEGETTQVSHSAALSHETLPAASDCIWESVLYGDITGRELLMTWEAYLQKRLSDYDLSTMSKSQHKLLMLSIYEDYKAYKQNYLETMQAQISQDDDTIFMTDMQESFYAGGTFGNANIEVSVDSDGRYTIGNVEGDPGFTSDNNRKLLYGHPNPGTTETLIYIDGKEYVFSADQVTVGSTGARAVMHISGENVIVYEDLMLTSSGNTSFDDCVKISYEIVNNNASAINAGVRIMLDTMLANNDDAPFKIPGTGNLTTIRTYTGNSIPAYYQVYDDLDNPTTLATGYLIVSGERTPDMVQFTRWGDVNDASWSYTADDGGSLGDSAVSIYFNPRPISSRNSISVATRYGAGLSTGMSGAQYRIRTLRSDEVGLQVVDNTSGDPIEGVIAERSDDSSTAARSDAGGTIIMALNDIKNKEIKLYKDGYQTVYEQKSWKGGNTYTVYMKALKDTAPKITSVLLGGKDLLTKTVKFTEDSSGVIDRANNSSKVYDIRINASSDSKDCVYYLLQEEELVAKSTDGSFQLKAMKGKHDAAPYITSLSAGKRYYIRCVGKDGRESVRRIGLEVVSPTVAFKKGELLNAGLSLGSGSGEAQNLLIKALTEDNDFKLSTGALSKFSVSIDPEKPSVKIGINVKPELLNPSNETAYRKFKNSMHKFSKNKNSSQAEVEKFESAVGRWTENKNKFTVAKVSGGLTVAGTVELSYQDGHYNGTLYVAVSGNVSGSSTYHFAVWAIPMYLQFGIDGKAELKFLGDIVVEDGDGLWAAIQQLLDEFTAQFYGYGEVGAGTGENIKVGGRFTAGIAYKHLFKSNYNTIDVTGKFSVEAKALVWEKSMTICEGTWNIYSGYASGINLAEDYANPDEPQTMEEAFEMLMEQPTVMADRDYLELSEDGSSEAAVMTVMPDAQPQSIQSSGVTYRFMLEDDGSRQGQNRTKLIYTWDDGQGNSGANAVDDDGTADFGYALAADAGHVYVLWQDCREVYGENADLDTMCKGVDLSFAVISSQTGEVEKLIEVTPGSDLYEQSPAILVSQDTVYLGWNATESVVFENISNSSIRYAAYQNGSKAAEGTVAVEDRMAVEDLSLRNIDGSVTAVYTLAAWKDLLSQDTQTTRYWKLGDAAAVTTPIPASEGALVFAQLDGKEVAFTMHDHNIYYGDYAGGETETALFKTEVSDEGEVESLAPDTLSADFVVINHGGETYVIWVSALTGEQPEYEQMRRAYAVKYSSGSWSKPYMLAELSYGGISDFAVTYDNEDVMTLTWLNTVYDETGTLTVSELCERRLTDDYYYNDIELTSYDYDDGGAPQGGTLTVSAVITNNGTRIIDTVYARILSNTADERIELNGLALAPGESITKEISFTVHSNEPEEYFMFLESLEDRDTNNGRASFETGGTRLEWYQRETQIIGSAEMAQVEIRNTSHVPAQNVELRVLSDAQDGALLYYTSIEEIGADESCFVNIPMEPMKDRDAYVYLLTDTPQREAMNPVKLNTATAAIQEVDSYSLSVTAQEGGTLEKSYDKVRVSEGDEVTIKAYPQDAFDFWKWESDQSVEIANVWEQETILIMPSEDTVVRALFRPHKEAESISLSEEGLSMMAGETTTLAAAVLPEDASQHVYWTSSDESVFKVSANGEVKAVAAGTAALTASCGTVSDSITVTVSDVPVENIELIGPVYITGIGKTEDLLPVITPDKATAGIIWSSADEQVAVVEHGIVTAVGVGTTTITAAAEDNPEITASVEVNVSVALEGIALDARDLTLFISSNEQAPDGGTQMSEGSGREQHHDGDTAWLTASLLPEGYQASSSVKWTVDNEEIVSLTPDGEHQEKVLIKALATGSVIVTAKYENFTAQCFVYVQKKIDSVDIEETEIKLIEGRSRSLSYEIEPYDADEDIVWSSSDESIVSVENDGTVYAYGAAGSYADITLTSASGAATDVCRVRIISNHVYAASIDQMQSDHYPYNNNEDMYYHYTASGASAIDVVFSDDTKTEYDYDYIYLLDGNGNEIGEYSGDELSGKSIYVPTASITIHFTSDSSSCDYYGFKVTTIRAHQHVPVVTSSAVAATCAAEGHTAGITCSMCGATIEAPKTIGKLAHFFGEWTTTVSPTALREGTQTRSCNHCGKKESRQIPKLAAYLRLNVSNTVPMREKQKTAAVKAVGMAQGDYVASWETSNQKIVTVSASGKITAKKKGKATITVTTAAGASASFNVKVQKGQVKTKKVIVPTKKLTLKLNETKDLMAVITPVTSQQTIKYKTSNKKVAAVSAKGVVTGKKKGKATVTIISGKKKVKIKVTVK